LCGAFSGREIKDAVGTMKFAFSIPRGITLTRTMMMNTVEWIKLMVGSYAK
jgi:hypothetical protein